MESTVYYKEAVLQPILAVIENGQVRNFPFDKPLLAFGRKTSATYPEITVTASFVSRKHGDFGHDECGYYFIDTGSSFGTRYNGHPLAKMKKQYLKSGDVLHVYNNIVNRGTDFVAIIFLTDYPENYMLETIPINPDMAELNIGRRAGGLLADNNMVSENHASFFIAKDGWALVDHNSTNGVYLNNRRLTTPRYLSVGDCVRIANIHFIYSGDSFLYQKAQSRLTVATSSDITRQTSPQRSFEVVPFKIHIAERSVWQRAKKLMLLQNINLKIHSGEMVLILGGSGAGKTTFMNAVMGYEKADGRILYGDTDIYEDFESMKYKIGFVPQQDLLRTSDTVYATISNAAEMKLPRVVAKAQREARIAQVLETLGLQRERDSLVSKLSGGQRKRLSIAVEYIADPSLFFLDEPDSGLDGIMAKALMRNLRTIADEGKIVMVISHAPDRTAQLFDKIIVLAKSTKDNCGHLAFFGPVKQAHAFFEVDSLEGVVQKINRPDEGGDGLSDYYIEKYQRVNG